MDRNGEVMNDNDQYSLRGRVFNKLREDILAGNYEENCELKEAAISKELGVSRTPVREALRQLELEGLVSIIPNKGAYVKGITAKDIYDIYVMRSYLEGLCARWACEHITLEQLEELEEIVYLSKFHIEKEHWDQIFELDNRFHLLLYQACGSKVLEHILTDYHHYVERVRKNTLSSRERASKAGEEHGAILEALKKKDEETAERLANEHIFRSLANIKHQGLDAGTMYVITFYRRGHYVVIALYGMMLLFFSNMYGSLKIGQYRRIEVLLSQFLSLLLTNILFYFIISLLAFGFVNPFVLCLIMAAEMVVTTLWNSLVIYFYNSIFQPWKLLLIYGERSAKDLIYKVETRRDKYAIYDSINIAEGMEAIKQKMQDFHAVIIGDITAECRNDLLKYCYMCEKRAYVVPKLSDLILMGAERIHVFDTPFLLSRGYALSFDERLLKRLLDLVLSFVLLVVTSPILVLVSAAVKLCDGGPVFYRQVRCTKDDQLFTIIKFRSMVVDAESSEGPVLASRHDDRVTVVGRFLRASRLDELPQLFNILKGDMSFVGPRPERPEMIQAYERDMPEFRFRTRVKAGLTGYAQVYGKYNTSPYDKLKLDLFYIENYSLWQDIKLILMTLKTVLKPSAAEGVPGEQPDPGTQSGRTTDKGGTGR